MGSKTGISRHDESKGRYTVIIEVYEHRPNDEDSERLIASTQAIAAVSVIQAIRRGGMKLVQKLTKEAEREILADR